MVTGLDWPLDVSGTTLPDFQQLGAQRFAAAAMLLAIQFFTERLRDGVSERDAIQLSEVKLNVPIDEARFGRQTVKK